MEILFKETALTSINESKDEIILRNIANRILKQPRHPVGGYFWCCLTAGDDHVGIFQVWAYLHDQAILAEFILGQIYSNFLLHILRVLRIIFVMGIGKRW